MSPRMGRPPKGDVSRDKKLNIRLNDNELNRIAECAEKLNLSRTDTIMRGIELLEQSIKK